ncbi:MAG: DUF5667 domain-containing protein [Chloroflexi bacterium]|nr:DUF5667 domain-containing protein [Chloroflexota bacterium]
MKDKVSPELLAECLDDLESGRLTIQECLATHPTLADELRSLLEVAHSIPPMPQAEPDPAFRLRSRGALVAAFSADKTPVTNPPFRRLIMQIFDGWAWTPRLSTGRMRMSAVVIAIIIAIATAAGGGAVYASQDAQPGDALYQVKMTAEAVQITLATSDEARAQTYLDLAGKRLVEIEKASEAGNPGAANSAAQEFTQDMAQFELHLAQAEASGKDVSELVAQLEKNLTRQQKRLSEVKERAPDQAKIALAEAAEAAEKGLMRATARIQRLPASERHETATPGQTPNIPASVTPTSTPAQATATSTPVPTATIASTVSMTFTRAISDVRDLAADPSVPGQSYNGLLAKLQAAQAALGRGQEDVAIRILDAFLHELDAMKRSDHISADRYNTLYASYNALVSALSSSSGVQGSAATPAPGPGQPQATPEPTRRPDMDDNPPGRPSPLATPSASDVPRGRAVGHATDVPVPSTPVADPIASRTPPVMPSPSMIPTPRTVPNPHADPDPQRGKR